MVSLWKHKNTNFLTSREVKTTITFIDFLSLSKLYDTMLLSL